jgi:phospholipase C
MFDENDGFFDHVPPPAPPSRDASGNVLGGSTIDTAGEYHLARHPSEAKSERDDLMGRPYGLGPRVPLYVISPWSRGGWVNAEVFDHTSVIRFLEKRFGVMEPNISAWRRAVCGAEQRGRKTSRDGFHSATRGRHQSSHHAADSGKAGYADPRPRSSPFAAAPL